MFVVLVRHAGAGGSAGPTRPYVKIQNPPYVKIRKTLPCSCVKADEGGRPSGGELRAPKDTGQCATQAKIAKIIEDYPRAFIGLGL